MQDTPAAALLRAARLIPVITIDHLEHAVPLANALVAGGVCTLEITLRTPVGGDAAALIQREVPDAVVGLGTVLNEADLRRVKENGLRFAVSPGSPPALLKAAAEMGVMLIPGIATPTELMSAMAYGFDVVKLFPAEPAGGLGLLRALAGPFPTARFCPTGGIGEDRIGNYLAQPNVLAVGGSWLASSADIARGDWTAITERASKAMRGLQA
jgi:2-dehydro-3-deoxyphosphogluconate aldolase/(4S)-4-hydroxy-2-oxoglutarate aldolase